MIKCKFHGGPKDGTVEYRDLDSPVEYRERHQGPLLRYEIDGESYTRFFFYEHSYIPLGDTEIDGAFPYILKETKTEIHNASGSRAVRRRMLPRGMIGNRIAGIERLSRKTRRLANLARNYGLADEGD